MSENRIRAMWSGVYLIAADLCYHWAAPLDAVSSATVYHRFGLQHILPSPHSSRFFNLDQWLFPLHENSDRRPRRRAGFLG